MRFRNPTFKITPGTPRYSSVQKIDTPAIRSRSSVVYGGSGGWLGNGCGWWGCRSWPWWNGVIPIAAPLFVDPDPCRVPIVDGALIVDGAWAIHCFWPAYAEARMIWGFSSVNVAIETMLALVPGAAIVATNGAEAELRRRIETAVAVLLNDDGIPTQYPKQSMTPRPPRADAIAVPWIRALVTGWV